MLKLPPIADPERYQGLFLYDFGDHVSVGYTAAEIGILKRSPRFRSGMAYQVYRVDEQRRFELRGVPESSLQAREALCFLRFDGGRARRDYDDLLRAASVRRLPCAAELRLVRSYSFIPADLTALVYPSWADHLISGWLDGGGLIPGDRIESGPEALSALEGGGGICIASTALQTQAEADRGEEAVLASTDQPLQR